MKQEATETVRRPWQESPLQGGEHVNWTLEAEGRGTRLFLVHEGFDPDDPAQRIAHKIMGGGWRSYVMEALKDVLTGLRPEL